MTDTDTHTNPVLIMESRLNKMTRPKKVQKRDGSLVPFAGEKIQNAIAKAAGEVLQDSISARAIASKLTATVIQKLFAQYKGQTLHVEAIQDAVETVLMEEGYSRIAKSYILYRERRSDIRSDRNHQYHCWMFQRDRAFVCRQFYPQCIVGHPIIRGEPAL